MNEELIFENFILPIIENENDEISSKLSKILEEYNHHERTSFNEGIDFVFKTLVGRTLKQIGEK